MTRSRASAKAAGSRHERVLADYFKEHVSEFVDRRVTTGARDKGDLNNVRTLTGARVAVEAKDYGGRIEASTWLKEAEAERINDEALVGLVIAKRRGVSDPGKQIVLMEVDDLVALLTGERPS